MTVSYLANQFLLFLFAVTTFEWWVKCVGVKRSKNYLHILARAITSSLLALTLVSIIYWTPSDIYNWYLPSSIRMFQSALINLGPPIVVVLAAMYYYTVIATNKLKFSDYISTSFLFFFFLYIFYANLLFLGGALALFVISSFLKDDEKISNAFERILIGIKTDNLQLLGRINRKGFWRIQPIVSYLNTHHPTYEWVVAILVSILFVIIASIFGVQLRIPILIILFLFLFAWFSTLLGKKPLRKRRQ